MPEGTNNSLIHFGDISKPATELIDKISQAVGGMFRPWQIKRVAEAESEAALIKAKSELEITELQERGLRRVILEEGKRQENMENITAKAIPLLTDTAKANDIDDDWMANFFDKSRIISNQEMQGLWAKVLAGEANAPGAFSKRTINFLAELEMHDAEAFSSLCSFCFGKEHELPFVFNYDDSIYTKGGIHFGVLKHLESIGLIAVGGNQGFTFKAGGDPIKIEYFGKELMLGGFGEALYIGEVILTNVGLELAPISGAAEVPGFFEYVKEQLIKLT